MATRFFRTPLRVHWADTDAAGVVYFGTYFRYAESAEVEMFRALGRPRQALYDSLRFLMPRVEASCRFRAPMRAEDLIEVGIAPETIAARRITYVFEMRLQETGVLVAEGSYRVACVSLDTFKPMDFPEELLRTLNRLPEIAT